MTTLAQDLGTPEQFRAFVREQVRAAMPPGWTLEESEQAMRVLPPPTDSVERSFGIILTFEARAVAVTHGNSDAGGMRLERLLRRATVIPVHTGELLPLRELLAEMFRREPPDLHGLT